MSQINLPAVFSYPMTLKETKSSFVLCFMGGFGNRKRVQPYAHQAPGPWASTNLRFTVKLNFAAASSLILKTEIEFLFLCGLDNI